MTLGQFLMNVLLDLNAVHRIVHSPCITPCTRLDENFVTSAMVPQPSGCHTDRIIQVDDIWAGLGGQCYKILNSISKGEVEVLRIQTLHDYQYFTSHNKIYVCV